MKIWTINIDNYNRVLGLFYSFVVILITNVPHYQHSKTKPSIILTIFQFRKQRLIIQRQQLNTIRGCLYSFSG